MPPAAAPGAVAQMTPEESRRRRAIAQMSDIRLQPVKQLPMTAIFLWLSGNEISIFTIMFLGMALMQPITALLGTSSMFEQFKEDAKKDKQIAATLSQSRLIYIGCTLVALGVALVKLQWMSLLPVCMMDWMSTAPVVSKEYSYGTVVY